MQKYLLSITIILLALVISACSSSEASETTAADSTTQTNNPDAAPTEIKPYVQTVGSFLAINEIGLGPEGYISLTNFTNVPVTTKGLYLCQGKDCFALPDAVIEAGETGRVAVGEGKGLENVVASKATIGELKPSDGEVALFASDKFDEPKAMLVYLQWGSTPHALTKLAVEAGLWIETGYAPTSPNATRLYRVPESGLWLFEEKP